MYCNPMAWRMQREEAHWVMFSRRPKAYLIQQRPQPGDVPGEDLEDWTGVLFWPHPVMVQRTCAASMLMVTSLARMLPYP